MQAGAFYPRAGKSGEFYAADVFPGRVPDRVVVGISGATGIDYGIRALEMLRAAGAETHLVLSRGARLTLAHESDRTVRDVLALADAHYSPDDLGAAIASGSFRTVGMIVAPCSVKTLAQVATGVCDTLLARAADVTLKERRRLVLMVRETPLTLTHLRNMTAVTENGGIIAPPVPAFYTRPAGLADVVDHTVGRALDLLGIDAGEIPRWGELPLPVLSSHLPPATS
jgi:4-hydroxy-3-polyprenylbenzoate decarboxylase